MAGAGLQAQIALNPFPSRALGHPKLDPGTIIPITLSPNLVEGRELASPQGLALDPGANPPTLYVSDTFNNRVLAWRDATSFANGAPADLVVGQPDMFSTAPQGPGISGASTVGLNKPTGLAVRDGNLFVVDSGNNRILRFPSPFSQVSQIDQFPDLVIGQPGFSSRTPNTGGVTASSLRLFGGGPPASACDQVPCRASLAFDAGGNLFVSDPGNNRVLRFRASDLTAGNFGPSADTVLGQINFTGRDPLTAERAYGSDNLPNKDGLNTPSAVAIDAAERIYVSDLLGRVVVFPRPTVPSGIRALRVMGLLGVRTGTQPTDDRDMRIVMFGAEGVFLLPEERVGVVDTSLSRILIFERLERWPSETTAAPSPQAVSVIGQGSLAVKPSLTATLEQMRKAMSNRGEGDASAQSLSAPVAAAFLASRNELFVVDSGNHRVLVFPQSGTLFQAANRVLGQLEFPFNTINLIEGREFQFLADAGLVVDTNSNPPHLYVADTYNNRVLGFNDVRTAAPGSRADLVIGQPDMFRSVCNHPNNDVNKPTQRSLCLPTGLALDKDGNLYVADTGNGRVLRFRQPFVQRQDNPLADLVLGQRSFTITIPDATPTTMKGPYGIAFDGDNRLLVSDVRLNRVLMLEKADGADFTTGMAARKVFGQADLRSGDSGGDDDRLNAPHHIAVDTDGRLYVADTGNNRVQIFPPVSNPVTPSTGARALSQSVAGLNNPRGVYVNAVTGEFWVAEAGVNRAVRFPKFDDLGIVTSVPFVPAIAPLALTQDQYGDLYVADGSNRVVVHYPGLIAVSAANYAVDQRTGARPLAPGMMAAICPPFRSVPLIACQVDDPPQFGEESAEFTSLPLPRELADIQVLVNQQPAPLTMVSPRQITFQVPMSAPLGGAIELQVVRKSTGQILGTSNFVQMNVAAPAFFTQGFCADRNPQCGPGDGQVRATNQDGSENRPTSPAPRDSVITLYATGQGPVPTPPPDGDAAQGGDGEKTDGQLRVIIGTQFVDQVPGYQDAVQESALVPGAVGLWQIKVKIPNTVAPGDAVAVGLRYKNVNTVSRTTIAVKQ